jgi:hypothetical protein
MNYSLLIVLMGSQSAPGIEEYELQGGAFVLLRQSYSDHQTIRKMESSMNGQVLECKPDSVWRRA